MSRPSIVRRLIDKVRGKKSATPPPVEVPAALAASQQKPKSKKRTDSSCEPLEGRIAPAILLNASTVQFTDTDGDVVTVKFSKPLFNSVSQTDLFADLDAVFKFKDTTHRVRTAPTGSVTDVNQLATLDLDALGFFGTSNRADGVSVSITATKSANGDGFVNVGYIRAASSPIFGISLGTVVVDGDLGQIDAGNREKAVGIKSLTVRSLGAVGLASQITSGASLESNVTGALNSLTVLENWVDASMEVVNGESSARQPGKIGKLIIGGSLMVGAQNTATEAGFISTSGSIGSIKIGTTTAHGIFGGAGPNSGLIKAGGSIGNVTVSGDVRGGAGKDSGGINGAGGIGNLSIGLELEAGAGENSGRIVSGAGIGAVELGAIVANQVAGNANSGKNSGSFSIAGKMKSLTVTEGITGGKGEGSGSVTVSGAVGKISIGHSITGGEGLSSGRVTAGSIGSATISRTIAGGAGDDSGALLSAGNIGSLTISNSTGAAAAVVAGTGLRSGGVSAGGNITTVKILGSLDGSVANAKDNGASISAGGHIASINVLGSLKGGAGELTGAIFASTIGVAKITGDLLGGTGVSSASITAAGKFTSVTILGSLDGGTGSGSASLVAGNDTANPADFGSVTVTGQLLGDAGNDSASIRAGGKIVKLTIGSAAGATVPVDKLKGGTGGNSASIFGLRGIVSATIYGNVIGDAGIGSGSIQAGTLIKSLTISGSLQGGAGNGSGSIVSRDRLEAITPTPGDLGTIKVNGAVSGSTGMGSGGIFADGSIKSLTIGSLSGGGGAGSGSIISGRGSAAFENDFKTIGGADVIVIKGSVTAGPGTGSGGIEAGSRIGSLTIDGGITGSSLKTGRDFGSIKVAGAVTDALISAQGSAKATVKADVAIGKLATGSVTNTQILAGYDIFGNPVNGNAQIGTVTVTGNWTASSMAAGVVDVDADGFGDDDDTVIQGGLISRIASITITGGVTGTADPADHFGFTAQEIAALKINGVAQALTTGKNTIPLAGTPVTDDTSAREVP